MCVRLSARRNGRLHLSIRRACRPRCGGALVAHALDEVLGQDRADQDRADHARLRVAANVGEPEAVAQIEHDEDREQDAGHPAGPAEDAHATEQYDGDDLQFESGAEIATDGTEAGREQDPAESGDHG